MHKMILLTILLIGITLAQTASKIDTKIPSEVQKMIDGYIQDSSSRYGLKSAQKFLHVDPSLKQTDIRVGNPLEVYYVRENALDTCKEDLPLKELLVPANVWTFPIQALGKYIYDAEIAKGKDGKWHWDGLNGLHPENWWQKLRKTYAESSGINPVLIRNNGFKYLYFPQKSPNDFFFIKNGNENFSFALNSSNSMDSLDDSRKFVPHLKKTWKDSQPYRDSIKKKYPGVFDDKNNDGGKK
jgi:hypothetical protein